MAQSDEKEKSNFTYVRINEEDKEFFTNNRKLEEYLVFKHKKLIKRQEDLMSLIRSEIEENLKSRK